MLKLVPANHVILDVSHVQLLTNVLDAFKGLFNNINSIIAISYNKMYVFNACHNVYLAILLLHVHNAKRMHFLFN